MGRLLQWRFACAYWVLYLIPFPIGFLPFTEGLAERLDGPRRSLAPWFARHVLHLSASADYHATGSGDSLFEWVSALATAVLALLATVVWSIVARRRDRPVLYGLAIIYVRYALGATMLVFGMSKVLPSQFPANDPMRLMEPFGNFSPMGLIWALMGASAPYTIITGAAETLGAVLLFFRRTTTLGALVLLPVLANVVFINLCYDVPVKLASMHYWLMALFLAGPDLRLMYDALVRRRAVHPAALDWRRAGRRWRVVMAVAKAALVSGLVYVQVSGGWKRYREHGNGRTVRPVEGIWDVDEVVGDGPRWRRLGIGNWRGAITTADEPYERIGVQYDDAGNHVTLRQGIQTTTFDIRIPDADNLILEGPFTLRLHRADPNRILLTSRGFHWVQEYPINR